MTRTQICLGTDGIEPSFGVVSEDLCMRIVILFPIASFYVSRSRETNRQSSARVKARSPTPRDTTLWSAGSSAASSAWGPRRASFRLVLHRPTCGVAWGATCPGGGQTQPATAWRLSALSF